MHLSQTIFNYFIFLLLRFIPSYNENVCKKGMMIDVLTNYHILVTKFHTFFFYLFSIMWWKNIIFYLAILATGVLITFLQFKEQRICLKHVLYTQTVFNIHFWCFRRNSLVEYLFEENKKCCWSLLNKNTCIQLFYHFKEKY